MLLGGQEHRQPFHVSLAMLVLSTLFVPTSLKSSKGWNTWNEKADKQIDGVPSERDLVLVQPLGCSQIQEKELKN